MCVCFIPRWSNALPQVIGCPVTDGCSFYLIQLSKCLHNLSPDNRSGIYFRNNVLLSKCRMMCEVRKPNIHLSSKLTNKNTHYTVDLIFSSIGGLEDKFLSRIFFITACNKTNQMHQFLIFIFGMKLYMFRTVPLSIIRSFSMYTQQCCMSYRCADSLRAGLRFLTLLASRQHTAKNELFEL